MILAPKALPAISRERLTFWPLLILIPAIFGLALYANLELAVINADDYQYFPPFQAGRNANTNNRMGGEFINMALSLYNGNGFADPFNRPTGPTAWQPPLYPLFMAGLLWLFDGDRDILMAVTIFLQVYTLIVTGFLVVVLALGERRVGERRGVSPPWLALIIYLAIVLWNFNLCFQITRDSWLVMLSLDIVIAGLCWWLPLSTKKRAALWGLAGGGIAMVNPIAGFTWGTLTLVSGIRQRAWSKLVLACAVTALSMTPWTIRNYLVFGRFIPTKSNVALEFYQSQCLQSEGVITRFAQHPYGNTPEGHAFTALGEIAYLDRKWEQFREAVAADPLDFADRVASRFLGATLWYVPFQDPGRPWTLQLRRLTHPVPFVALVLLIFSSFWKPLQRAQWIVIGVYALYLLPYIVISYYERYAFPLLGIKVLFVFWATDRLLSLRDYFAMKSRIKPPLASLNTLIPERAEMP